jgi:hypothetical protein
MVSCVVWEGCVLIRSIKTLMMGAEWISKPSITFTNWSGCQPGRLLLCLNNGPQHKNVLWHSLRHAEIVLTTPTTHKPTSPLLDFICFMRSITRRPYEKNWKRTVKYNNQEKRLGNLLPTTRTIFWASSGFIYVSRNV